MALNALGGRFVRSRWEKVRTGLSRDTQRPVTRADPWVGGVALYSMRTSDGSALGCGEDRQIGWIVNKSLGLGETNLELRDISQVAVSIQ
jgi:hypothetical protein